MAAWGLAMVLIGVSGFALGASKYTDRAIGRALAASRISADTADASRAQAEEQSLASNYRGEPGSEASAQFDRAAAAVVDALDRVRADGDAADVSAAAAILAMHGPYTDAVERMIAAADRGDSTEAATIAGTEVDPMSAELDEALAVATRLADDRTTSTSKALSRAERFTSTMTPIVFLVGLVLVAALAAVLRRVRRQVENQGDRMLHDSLHDALTGLPARVLLMDRVDQALRAGRRDSHLTGLLLIDLDRFKEVKDTLGHRFGDLLLAQIGPRLASALRDADTIAWLGSDEFAVLLPMVESLAEAIIVAEKVSVALSAPFAVEGVDLSVEASIGVVVSGAHGDDATALLHHADVAMYVAKEQCIEYFAYKADLDDHTPARFALLGDLRGALDRHEIVLHFQPQVSLTTWEICGAEALVRWQHPVLGMIPPDQFIPLAECTALIGPLTLRILDLALAQIRSWLDAGFEIPVAVNLSARSLLDRQLDEEILDLLCTHEVSARLLGLEVTESAIMTAPFPAVQMLTRLREQGVRIAIDDFGAGYTSLAQLKSLPVTELKIDRSFISAMDGDPGNALIVRSVVELGHNLGLTVVAEGVETDDVLEFLTETGCDIAQGYRVSPPLPADGLLTCYTNVQAL